MKRYIEVKAENTYGEPVQLGVRLVEQEESYGFRNRIIHEGIDPILQFTVGQEIVGDMKLSRLLKSTPEVELNLPNVTVPKESVNEIRQVHHDYFLQLTLPEAEVDFSPQIQQWNELKEFAVVFEDGRIWSLEDTVKAEIVKDIALLQADISSTAPSELLTPVFGAARIQRINDIEDKVAYAEKLNDLHLEGAFIYGDRMHEYLHAMKENWVANDIVAAPAHQLRPLRGRLLNQVLNKDTITLEIRSFPLREVIDEREVVQLVLRDNQQEVVYSLWGNDPLAGELEPYAIYTTSGDYLLEDFIQVTPKMQQLLHNYVEDNQEFSMTINDVAPDKVAMLKEVMRTEQQEVKRGKSLSTGDLPFDFS